MSLFRGEQGSITIVALLILVVLTILGVAITRTTILDLRIGTNELIRKQNFYVAEGGIYREAAEVGEGISYVVTNINQPAPLANQNGIYNPATSSYDLALPGAAHQVHGKAYNFDVGYIGHYLPPKGYSVAHFSRYDFDIDADYSNVNVDARFYRIGPKAN